MAAGACSAASTRRGRRLHEAAVAVGLGAAQHEQDRDGDEDPDDRVGEREPQQHPDGAGHDGQGGEAVGAGVQAVGDQGRGADLASEANAVPATHPEMKNTRTHVTT